MDWTYWTCENPGHELWRMLQIIFRFLRLWNSCVELRMETLRFTDWQLRFSAPIVSLAEVVWAFDPRERHWMDGSGRRGQKIGTGNTVLRNLLWLWSTKTYPKPIGVENIPNLPYKSPFCPAFEKPSSYWITFKLQRGLLNDQSLSVYLCPFQGLASAALISSRCKDWVSESDMDLRTNKRRIG